jgi:putative endonuclease
VAKHSAKDELGRSGEHHARLKLEALGYVFVASNWHCQSGELDLVMLDDEELVFVEVKTRQGENAGRADDAISDSKADKLLTTGEWFVAEHPDHQDRVWRIDLVAITIHPITRAASVNHYVNAVVTG